MRTRRDNFGEFQHEIRKNDGFGHEYWTDVGEEFRSLKAPEDVYGVLRMMPLVKK